jgi:hypothetical protein
MLRLELADEARVPQLARDAQVLAAAHERVALRGLRRGRDAARVEVLLLAARDRDEPAEAHERVLARHDPRAHVRLRARREAPPAWPERAVEHAPVLDLGQVDEPVCVERVSGV